MASGQTIDKQIYENLNDQQIIIAGKFRKLTLDTTETFSPAVNLAVWQALKLMDDEIKDVAKFIKTEEYPDD